MSKKKSNVIDTKKEAVEASRTLISPLGNAAAILGFHSTLVFDSKLKKRLLKAALHAEKACLLLNKVVYR